MPDHFSFEIEADDKLSREQWSFWFYERPHAIVVNAYYVESRPTKKHGYKVTKRYTRQNARTSDPGTTIKEEDIPLTDAIKHRALVEYVKGLRVVLWSAVSEGR